MKARTTLALLALLAVLAAAAFFVQGPGRRDREREHAPLLPGLKTGEVSLVSVTRGGAEVLLTREGGSWKLGAGKEPADAAAVEALLTGLAGARVAALVSTNAARQEAYEADEGRGTAVRLEGEGGKELAAFVVGRRGPDFASCYLRRAGASEVLLVTPDLRLNLSRSPEAWREPPKAAEPPASESPVPPPAARP